MINSFANHYLRHKFRSGLKSLRNNPKSDNNDLNKIPKSTTSPTIILGMHRSGTTMLSQIIRKSGLNLGWLRGSDTDESLFFQCLNSAIFSCNDSSWDEPKKLEQALMNQEEVTTLVNNLAEFSSKRKWTYSFLGKKIFSNASLFKIKDPWGWKDPRTCYTLPLWLKLFPDAKIIFIYRNGVDVSNSLYQRNSKLELKSKACSTLLGAFQLWDMYNTRCIQLIKEIPSSRLHKVKYEELLSNPSKEIALVSDFLDIKLSDMDLEQVSSKILSRRGFAFRGNLELEEFYDTIKSNKMMNKFGYSSL